MHIRIGNQTAISAGSATRPFAFAVEQGFDAFEWFPDRNEAGAGWSEDDLDREQRAAIRESAHTHGLSLSVHAPWRANPLNPKAAGIFEKCITFAEDIGATLFNLHFYYEQGPAAFARAVVPLIQRLASTRIRLSFENTPLTGPEECNGLFEALARSSLAERERLGMCLDLGHANLCRATHNDYLRFMDRLNPDIPIIHVHVHENYGDRDSHLPLFTGPAGRDPSGIQRFLQRLAKRGFSGCFILEQWPDPPTLLCEARSRLREMIEKLFPEDGATPPKAESLRAPVPAHAPISGRAPASPPAAPDFLQKLVEADRRNRSWREKLAWIREVLNSPEIASDLETLTCLAVYLRFIGTGQVSCTEDGRHFRPSHHAVLAREIGERLAGITTSQNVHIVRIMLPWLPSSASEFTHAEPLTLIRDIAHRNDIPRELKTEIKHTLQNKLHRCAGPEDLVTSAAILGRITASAAPYSPDFVAQFQHFHEQLKEFFNARGLDEQLESLAGEAKDPDADLIRAFLDAKAGSEDLPQLMRGLRRLNDLRGRFADRLQGNRGSSRQQLQLADIRLEEYAFVLLSQMINHFERSTTAPSQAEQTGSTATAAGQAALSWPTLLECLLLTVGNLRCSGFDEDECRAVEAEFEAWRHGFSATDELQALRLKATLERARRLADGYRDTVLNLFPSWAASLGQALGVAAASVQVYAESAIRSHVVFQLAKLVTLSLKALRERAGWSPWEVIVPGEATGVLVPSPTPEQRRHPEEPAIALIDRLQGDEEIPRMLAGVIVSHETPYLSHFAVRARERGVVFVASESAEPLSAVRLLLGHRVVLKASPEHVAISPAAAAGSYPAPPQHSGAGAKPSRTPAIEFVNEMSVLPLDRTTVANAGGKAYGARLLKELTGRDGGNFRTPRSLVIPFGVMEASLHLQPSLEQEYYRCRDLLQHLSPEDWPANLETIRTLVRSLEVPDEVIFEAVAQFGSDFRLIVRSSSSCEDLAQTAGAGLYESVANVAAERLADAVREVWASLWSLQAAANRRNAGIPHDRAFMAVLIQELIVPDLSFIMHTINPVTGNPDEVLVELAVGLGQTLAAADRPGNPYRLVGDKCTGETRLLAFANFSVAVFPHTRAGTLVKTLDYSQIKCSRDDSFRQSLGRRLTTAGRFVEEALEAPQDIEGVIAGETLYLVQSRPQQGLAK